MLPTKEITERTIRDWVVLFNQYKSTSGLSIAATRIWDDWNTADNPYFDVLPNPEALIFRLLTYIPDRADNYNNSIASAPNDHEFITWSDAPIYDTPANRLAGKNTWHCIHWQRWHQELDKKYGTYNANFLWQAAWNHEDNWCYAYVAINCPKTEICRYDCDFVRYLASKGMEVGNMFSNLVCDLSGIVLNITEAVEDTTKTVKTTVPLAIGGLTLMAGAKIYNFLK